MFFFVFLEVSYFFPTTITYNLGHLTLSSESVATHLKFDLKRRSRGHFWLTTLEGQIEMHDLSFTQAHYSRTYFILIYLLFLGDIGHLIYAFNT